MLTLEFLVGLSHTIYLVIVHVIIISSPTVLVSESYTLFILDNQMLFIVNRLTIVARPGSLDDAGWLAEKLSPPMLPSFFVYKF